jgi:transcriptional regulator of arginine metabolism
MNTKKTKRINKLLDILKNKNIDSQNDIVKELKKNGFEITQATLSRDLATIGAVRVREKKGFRYLAQPETLPIHNNIVVFEVKEILSNETNVVVKTLPGCAQSVAVVIDSWSYPELMCTVAGDDTILVIPTSIKQIKKIVKILHKELC